MSKLKKETTLNKTNKDISISKKTGKHAKNPKLKELNMEKFQSIISKLKDKNDEILKKFINKEIEKECCIYMIFNNSNGKLYIGATNSPKTRWKRHIRVAKNGKEKYPDDFSVVHQAICKYGKENFIFQVLERFYTMEEAFAAETPYIQFFNSNSKNGYNCNDGGLGGISPNQETIEKIRKALTSPKNLERMIGNTLSKGIVRTQAQKDAISKTLTGRTGRKHSEESKKKMSEVQMGHPTSEETKQKISLALKGKPNVKNQGSNQGISILTDEQVLEIREKFIPYVYTHQMLADEYGVSNGTIRFINQRKTWRHLCTEEELAKYDQKREYPINKLTKEQVLEIRAKHIPYKYSYQKLSTEYGVPKQTIQSIIERKIWKNI
jgi:group I intron endonuclease